MPRVQKLIAPRHLGKRQGKFMLLLVSRLINGLSVGAVYALIAVGFALIFSVMKFSNFAHGGVIAAAAYIGFFATRWFQTNFLVTLLIGMVGGGLVALFVEFVGFRRMRAKKSPLIFYFISSITIGIMLENILTIINGTNFFMMPRFFTHPGFRIGNFVITISDIMMFVISLVALACLLILLKKTRLGLAIRAVAMDNSTARLMGASSTLVVMSAFFIAGGLAGICGVFLGMNFTVFPQLGQMVVKGFIASIIGGLGSLGGAVAGAFLLAIAEVFIQVYMGAAYATIVTFLLMIAFLLVRPRGISGILISEKV